MAPTPACHGSAISPLDFSPLSATLKAMTPHLKLARQRRVQYRHSLARNSFTCKANAAQWLTAISWQLRPSVCKRTFLQNKFKGPDLNTARHQRPPALLPPASSTFHPPGPSDCSRNPTFLNGAQSDKTARSKRAGRQKKENFAVGQSTVTNGRPKPIDFHTRKSID